MTGELDDVEDYRRWGAPSVTHIFGGDYWGLISSNFFHVEIWHIAFNLYWLWFFGRKIEFESEKLFYIFLILSSALISSLAQLSFSPTTGIGLSGIGYALFGYLYVKSKTTEAYKGYLDKNTIYLFLFWLVLCIVLTKTGIMSIGNAAHIGGLAWGALLAYIGRRALYLQWIAGISYVGLLILMIFYSPFSTSYLSYQAYVLHNNQKVDEAITVYQKILKRDPGSEFARENLKQLTVYQLEKKASDLHTNEKYSEARELYNQILSIDKDNEWAKENLKLLPDE